MNTLEKNDSQHKVNYYQASTIKVSSVDSIFN
jgi:hypothetical protein